jgi:hypothetical protein
MMFEEPPASLMTKNVAGGPKPTSTPTATPPPAGATAIPASDHLLLHQSAEAHAQRELKQFEVTPEAEARVEQSARDAAEKAYRDAVAAKKDPTQARKEASNAAKQAAKTTSAAEGEAATKAKVEEKISTGDVFDQTKMSNESKQALVDFRTGARGGAAKKLAPQLEGKTAVQMEAVLDADPAVKTKTTQDIADPTHKPGDPSSSPTQKQLVYQFEDGTLVRIKPKGDKFNPGSPMYSVEVNQQLPAGSPKTGQNAVAFKVDAQGRPVPKGPDQIKNPYNHGTNQKQNIMFQQMVMDAGHKQGS